MTLPSSPPGLLAVDHIHVFVADRAAAERWYHDVLGFTRVPELTMWTDDGGPLTVRNAADTVHLALFERPAQRTRSTVALRVDAAGFLAWRAHLTAALGRAIEPVDHTVSWSLYFEDPDGNPYEITSYEYVVLRQQLQGAAARQQA
jgi:catechol-2,3-dioxygenase